MYVIIENQTHVQILNYWNKPLLETKLNSTNLIVKTTNF